MIEFGSNRLRSIQEYYRNALSPLYGKDESNAIIYSVFEHVLGYRRHELVLHADDPLNESTIVDFVHILKRLKEFEPLQYVIGHSWFRGLKMYVSKDVLIPRPETEELVELIVNENNSIAPVIVDLCTGSGCIAIALANEIPAANVTGIDVSAEALKIAEQNSLENNIQVNFIEKDILKENALKDLADHSIDIIVSNPPYIGRSEAATMHDNVLRHEPEIALFVDDEDVLLFYRVITNLAKNKLKKQGKI